LTTDNARERLLAAIDNDDVSLRELSLEIHAHPELAFQEVHAHQVLTEYLEERGFEVTRGAYGLPTAFRAIAGTGSPIVVVLCEYDALPGIGHACGHNLIAMAGVAAGLGVKAAIEPGQGTIVVLGSPAEESGGGKVELIRKGAFEGVAAAMMVHPVGATGGANAQVQAREVRADVTSLAVDHVRVDYFGKEAHAGGRPWEGINALDAAVHAYQAVGLLRQQIPQTARVHGIITKGVTPRT
jgi:amidohydrolase